MSMPVKICALRKSSIGASLAPLCFTMIALGFTGCRGSDGVIGVRWDKDIRPYSDILSWQLIALANSPAVNGNEPLSDQVETVSDAFLFRQAANAFRSGYVKGAVNAPRQKLPIEMFGDMEGLPGFAYREGLFYGLVSAAPPDCRKSLLKEYVSFRTAVAEFVLQYWSGPFAYCPAEMRQQGGMSPLPSVPNEQEADVSPAFNPYEQVWVSYSNSYVRTARACRKPEARLNKSSSRYEPLLVAESSVVPEYRAYAYGHYQALLDCSTAEAGADDHHVVLRLKLMHRLENGMVEYLRARLSNWSCEENATGQSNRPL